MSELENLLQQVRSCTICSAELPLGPRPILSVSPSAKILIIGQAPGTKVHNTGIPWNDPSGDKLREWMDIDRETFYDGSRIAIMPMGLCYLVISNRTTTPLGCATAYDVQGVGIGHTGSMRLPF